MENIRDCIFLPLVLGYQVILDKISNKKVKRTKFEVINYDKQKMADKKLYFCVFFQRFKNSEIK